MTRFILTVDIEPPDRQQAPGERPDWSGFPLAIERLTDLRRRLSKVCGRKPHFSWFVRVDPQIAHLYGDAAWAMRRYAAELRSLEREGDAIGLHVHPFRWSEHHRSWTSDCGDPEWIRRCIRLGVEGFRRAWGESPRIFRFGDRWMSNEAMDELERHGVELDLTLEPGMKPAPGMLASEKSTGELPDYRHVPRRPYRPDGFDYRKPATGAAARHLWILPVTTGCFPGSSLSSRIRGTAARLHLNLGLRSAWIQPLMHTALETQPLVVSVARTGDLAEREGGAEFESNLEQLASHPRTATRWFLTPLEWKSEEDAKRSAGRPLHFLDRLAAR